MGDNGDGSKHPHQEFKVGAADEKGHIERIQLRVPPQMFSKMQKAVNSHKWPYENYQELVRHAIMKQLLWLEADDPGVGNLTAQVQSINMMLGEETELQRMEETYQKMKSVFQKNLAIGGDEARNRNLKLMADLWQQISRIDDEFWRGLWMRKFKEEYDKVRESVPDMGLGVFDEGEAE